MLILASNIICWRAASFLEIFDDVTPLVDHYFRILNLEFSLHTNFQLDWTNLTFDDTDHTLTPPL